MARRNISFDGISLQDSTYQVQEFLHESIDGRDFNFQRISNRDGAVLISQSFAPKTIRLKGIIKGTDIENLEENIDALKELLNRREKDLVIEYANGERTYVASSVKMTLERAHYNITFAPFEAEFIVSNPPFGKGSLISTTDGTYIFTSTGTAEGLISFSGTSPFQKPIITIDILDDPSPPIGFHSITIKNITTGYSISVYPISNEFTAPYSIIINTVDYTITDNNGVSLEYEGFFPDFTSGDNNYKIIARAGSVNLNVSFKYYPYYL
jgi:predicted phage tail component-like protein